MKLWKKIAIVLFVLLLYFVVFGLSFGIVSRDCNTDNDCTKDYCLGCINEFWTVGDFECAAMTLEDYKIWDRQVCKCIDNTCEMVEP